MDDVRQIAWHLDCDIFKAEEESVHGQKVRRVSGIAAEESPDQVGETTVVGGINFNPLLATGYFNYDHLSHPSRSDLGPEALIGVPTTCEVIKSERGFPALKVEGYLYNDPDLKPLADACWRHMQMLKKSVAGFGKGVARQMGFSVEGITLMKIGGRIEKSLVRQLAITHKPAHLHTGVGFAEVMKSLDVAALLPGDVFLAGERYDTATLMKMADTVIDNPLMREDLRDAHGNRLRRRSRGEKAMRAIYGSKTCSCGELDPKTGKCKHGMTGLIKHMTECAGWDKGEAESFGTLMKNAWGE